MHKPFLFISIFFVLCFIGSGMIGCKDNAPKKPNIRPQSADAAQKPTTNQYDDKIKVDGELKAQLEAAGYVVKDKQPKPSNSENPYANVDLEGHMEGIDGTFVFLDVQKDVTLIHNSSRAEKRFSPCSTFKIPHSLIALETGAASGPDQIIHWDAQKYPKEPWWDTLLAQNDMHWDRDHTLATAFRNSCVWYYRETAKEIGPKPMQFYLDAFDYGNKNQTSGADSFWLDGSLQISAVEQVRFLKRLVQNDLGLKTTTVQQAKKIFEKEKNDSAVLYAKTGGGKNIGWFVGFIQHKDQHYIFAFNMAGSFEEVFQQRVKITMRILTELGVWGQ